MVRKCLFTALVVALLFAMQSCAGEEPLDGAEMTSGFDVGDGTLYLTSKADCYSRGLELVRLKGKVRHFGYDILQNPPVPKPRVGIPDVHVWLAEYPASKRMNILTDADGMWELFIIKRKGVPFPLSMTYEKDHYTSDVEARVFPNGIPVDWNKSLIRSNVHTVMSDDIDDFAMQMPDELFLFYAKSTLEAGLSQAIGIPYTIENLAVATVGKFWASIYDPTLPHGDPGATVWVEPAPATPLSGPIYFDETVTPNPAVTTTSVDGGVLFNNLQPGTHRMTAVKESFSYETVEFTVDPAVRLYVASPPHSIQGNNPSGPGEP